MTLLSFVAAFVVGALLSLSGAVLQSVLRNPLAEPYMLGLTGGASLFVAVALHLGWVAISFLFVPCMALLGAIFSLAIVCGIGYYASKRVPYLLAESQLRNPGNMIVLAGFVTASFMCSLQMLVLSFATPDTFATLSKWLFGDLRMVRLPIVIGAGIVLGLTLVILLSQAKALDILGLGGDRAECLGINVRKTVFVTLGTVSLATACAVATAGAIGFIGLVIPHLARYLFGERHQWCFINVTWMGGLLLVLAEGMGRFLPGNLSAGVVAALAGPFFLFFLIVTRHFSSPPKTR